MWKNAIAELRPCCSPAGRAGPLVVLAMPKRACGGAGKRLEGSKLVLIYAKVIFGSEKRAKKD